MLSYNRATMEVNVQAFENKLKVLIFKKKQGVILSYVNTPYYP